MQAREDLESSKVASATSGDDPLASDARAGIEVVLDSFLHSIQSLAFAYAVTTKETDAHSSKALEQFAKSLVRYGGPEKTRKLAHLLQVAVDKISEDSPEPAPKKPRSEHIGSIDLKIPAKEAQSFADDLRSVSRGMSASSIVRGAMLLALVGQYDAFLGRLIKALYALKPHIIPLHSINIKFSDLREFGSLDEVEEYLVEQQIESVLRESHLRHFEWLEERLGVKLREGLEAWASFIEITERRNLIAHASGVVSKQYRKVCAQNSFPAEKLPKIGRKLSVDHEYFDKAVDTLLEIGIKLGHVSWRVLGAKDKRQRARADIALNRVSLDLIEQGDYDVAARVLEFFLFGPKAEFSNDYRRRIALINLSQAHKWAGRERRALELLDTVDWSASSNEFRLAIHVLRSEYDDAAHIMRTLGAKGPIQRANYIDWPLFKEFRTTPKFREAFKKVFREEFASADAQQAARKTVEELTLLNAQQAASEAKLEEQNEVAPRAVARRRRTNSTRSQAGRVNGRAKK